MVAVRVSRDAAGLLAAIGVALLIVAFGMLDWTRGTGDAFLGYAAAVVTGIAGLTSLVVAAIAAGWRLPWR